MNLQKWFFSVAACAVMLGLSTTASANISGLGCTIAGTLAGQNAIGSLTGGFLSQCTTAATGGTETATFTFSTNNDTLSINEPAGGTNTPNGELLTGGITNCTGTSGTGCGGLATGGNSGTAAGSTSTEYDFHETNIVPGTYTINLTHDDGVTLFHNGVIITGGLLGATGLGQAGPTTVQSTGNISVTIAAGDTLDVVYDECCGLPGVLTGALPAEASVPEPTSIVLLGSMLVLGSMATRRRRMKGGNSSLS